MRNLIILPDGTEITSGSGQINNIRKLTITKSVNEQTELTLGSACSAMLECTLQTPHGGLNIAAGTEITLYRVDDAGERRKVGLFTMESPVRPSAHLYKITAYDRVSWLDKDLTSWLASLDGWPYTVSEFAAMVCGECGLTLAETAWINGDYPIQQFIGDGITGRQLIKWVGEIEAKFVRANADGEIELGWYRESGKIIAPTGGIPYMAGSLTYEDYQIQPIEQVRIQLSGDDIGVAYPDVPEGLNAYAITGNYLLTTTDPAMLEPAARNIHSALDGFAYTPCEVRIWATDDVDVGDIVAITDGNGVSITTCIMNMKKSGQSMTLESSGAPKRNSSSVVNNVTMGALNAKMLEIKKDISGLEIKATNIETKVSEGQVSTLEQIAAIRLQADGIATEVSSTIDGINERMSSVEQSAESWGVRIEAMENDGVSKVSASGVTVDEDGLHVWKEGEPTTSTLDHEGLNVTRASDGESVLVADKDGVNALNVTVRKYLSVGGTRFESYSSGGEARTAMFFTGEVY